MAEILEGLLLINQTDVYARFGAFLAETAEDRHDNYDSLLAPPALKQPFGRRTASVCPIY